MYETFMMLSADTISPIRDFTGEDFMKFANINNSILRRRLIITLAFAVIAAIAGGISFSMMRARVPDMHIIFFLLLGSSVLLLIFLSLWTLGAADRFARLAKILRRCYIIFLVAGFSVFLVFQGLIISAARTQEADVDAIIVLGAGLRRDDSPSIILRGRLDAAIAYLETRENVPVIVSGGLGEGQSISEAEAMFRYLRTMGVDENLIWREDASTNTYENIAFSRQLMKDRGMDVDNMTVAIVSSEFHLYRATLIAENAGLDAVGVAAATPSSRLRVLYFFREAFALASEMFL